MYIDIHMHAFHPKISGKVLAQLEDHYAITPVGTGLVDDLLARIERAHLDTAVVLTAATTPAQVIPANNWSLSIKRDHPQLIPFGTVHPGFDAMEQELDRLEANGIKGLKFHPDFQGFRLDDPALYDVMEMVGDRFVCLFHVGDALPPEENPSCPRKLAQLRKVFPAPVMIAAHMGGYLHWEYALEHLAATDVLVDSSSTLDFVDDPMLLRLYRAFGSRRILFGSDYPLFDPGTELERLQRRLNLSSGELEAILSNAGDILARHPVFARPKEREQAKSC
ncbi:MAG: amidohydrolase family protein [Pseudodesulfovibrio sp.]|uniref:Amidohydrolase 2 n=1 Tax=Pseudodesulfovibrio aespoeensis (strain ATCC 700646 / DSM 10631 / Aspo-2) TaxID=643562 RepID=E6VW05_PSEA9|nr:MULTISPECIES: amidohydrolase family protein [Pseudodesulfovibrio]MBU4244625.1 amidohydrolase family protein [Pseudomonadota bacterium]ADU62450.1 amidohydrolase 2 [Pseudodesulfovibrio aespoeensis Aspo-2]MBU4379746.1 amidohydrolase family protein [Pseudomonadota bacterium]MBU4473885.1 amidohydrolase family protein [Pseudomonadota bacterium]MBU4515083.1 amidohydrolase family protein [Pseudomonadota bacterium]